MSFQWFRMWTDAIDDEKLKLLAFEDRWHFVALLCLKRSGLLDEPPSDLRTQKICVKMGLDRLELETAMKRLVTVGLINEAFQPLKWKKRQFESDSSTSRVRAFRERHRNGGETFQKRTQTTDSDTDTESEKKKTPPRAARGTPQGGVVILHESLPTEEWNQWLALRRKRRWPIDELTLSKQLKVLREHDTEIQRQIINASINAGWQGLFPPKGRPANGTADAEPKLTWRPPDDDGNPDHARRR